MKSKLVATGRIVLAVMFLLSAISKLISMPFFDGMVAELFLGANYYDTPENMLYTQVLSRLLVAIELVLGVAVLTKHWLKKITLPAIFFMLLLFTIHLTYEGLTSAKGFVEGNCGCFGDVLPMNNLESILKNVAAMVITILVFAYYNGQQLFKSWVAPLVTGLVTFGTLSLTIKNYEPLSDLPSIELRDSNDVQQLIDTLDAGSSVEPGNKSSVDETPLAKDGKSSQANDSKTTQTAEASKSKLFSMVNQLGKFSNGKAFDPSGTKLLCMFSMTCAHCQESYKEICEMTTYGEVPPIYLVNYGRAFEQEYFVRQAGNLTHPYIRTEDYNAFNRVLEGKGFPRILVVQDGRIVKEFDIDSYNKDAFMAYFKLEEPKKDGLITPKNSDDIFDDDELWK